MIRRPSAVLSLRLAALLSVALTLGACVTLGHPFDADKIKSLTVGKTTQTEVQGLFGDPFRTGVDTGDITWTYLNYHFGVFGPQKATDLVVKFGADGTVKSYAFNTTEPEKAQK